jgi:hypothetical protein
MSPNGLTGSDCCDCFIQRKPEPATEPNKETDQ